MVLVQPVPGLSYAPISITPTLALPRMSVVGVVPVPASLAAEVQPIRRPSSAVRKIPSGPAGLAALTKKGLPLTTPVP